jgi:hypothetical protein
LEDDALSSLKINGKEYNDIQLVKLQKGKTDEAIQSLNSAKQGADDVVFKVGDDVFVASGRDLFPGKPADSKPSKGGKGITVELDGKQAEVLAWDNQANNGKECAKWASLEMIVPAGALTIAAVAIPKFKPIWGLIAGAATWLASIPGAYLYGDSRKMNLDGQAALGTVLQKNTQSKGGLGEAIQHLFGRRS